MVALQYMEHRPPQVCNAAVYSDSVVMVHCDDEVILIITTALGYYELHNKKSRISS